MKLNILYWFRRKKNQIHRLIDFFPLIWGGYDFDYRYSLELFKKQLHRTADYLESDRAVASSAKNSASRIRTAIRLMDKVYDEEYGMAYMDYIDKLYGKTNFDFVESDMTDKDGGKLYELKLRNENAVDELHQKEIDEVRTQMLLACMDKQRRAHKLLWEFIEWNIGDWWD